MISCMYSLCLYKARYLSIKYDFWSVTWSAKLHLMPLFCVPWFVYIWHFVNQKSPDVRHRSYCWCGPDCWVIRRKPNYILLYSENCGFRSSCRNVAYTLSILFLFWPRLHSYSFYSFNLEFYGRSRRNSLNQQFTLFLTCTYWRNRMYSTSYDNDKLCAIFSSNNRYKNKCNDRIYNKSDRP